MLRYLFENQNLEREGSVLCIRRSPLILLRLYWRVCFAHLRFYAGRWMGPWLHYST